MILKLGMAKAYGELEWSFVDRTLKAWGFSKGFRKLI